MTAETRRLRWRCRRGAKELDVLLSAYFERRYAQAPAAQQRAFEQLLELPDPDLLKLLLGRRIMDDPAVDELVTSIRDAADR